MRRYHLKEADIYENAEYNEYTFSNFYTTKINKAMSHVLDNRTIIAAVSLLHGYFINGTLF